jgi:O-antigen/teichoic acid export membrane protein
MLVDRVVPYWLFATSVLFSSVIVGAAIVPVIFGRSFDASAHVLATLMLASAAVAVYSVFATLLYAIGATWALTALQLGSGAVNVVMDLVLIPRYGAPGAALATVCASGVAALGALGVARDRLSLPRVRRQLTLGLPVVVVYACFAIFGGARFYPVAIAAGAGASCWLVSAFRLFSKDALERLGDAHVFSPGPTAGMLAADRRAGSR